MTPAPLSSYPPTAVRFWPVGLVLASGGFAIGTIEFLTMGLLPQMAVGVGVGIPTAGRVVSAYALGVVVGAPVLALLGAGRPPRRLLVLLLLAYAGANIASGLAPGYSSLLALRLLAGVPHAAYFGTAATLASALVPPERRARAISSALLGLGAANVLGVPAATWAGQHLGWRTALVGAGLLPLVTVLLVLIVVPAVPPSTLMRPADELRSFATRPVLVTLVAASVGFGGLFAVYTYIAPLVTEVAGLAPEWVPIVVLAFGLGMVAGTWLAGELGRCPVMPTLLACVAGSAISLVLFWAVVGAGVAVVLGALLMTTVGGVMVIELQLRLIDLAGPARAMGAAMTHAALNVANALGAWLGGLAVAHGLGYRSAPLVGATLAAVGLLLLVPTRHAQARPAG